MLIDLLLLLTPLVAISLYYATQHRLRIASALAATLHGLPLYPRQTMRRAGIAALELLGVYWLSKILLLVLMFLLLQELSSPLSIPMRALALVLAFLAPDLWILSRARKRRMRIEYNLGFFIDQLLGLLPCGLTLDQAVNEAVSRGLPVGSPLREELMLWRQEIAAGVDRGEAFDRLSARSDSAELRSLVLVLKTAYDMGGEVTPLLGHHAELLRLRERERGLKRINGKLMLSMVPLVLANFPLFLLLIFFTPLLELSRMFPQFGF